MGPGRIGRYVVLAVALWAAPASAQDSHYWTNQYGTRAELLGGTVVGSIKDLSCVYYNPGAMALVENPELVLTTDAFQVETIDLNTSSDRLGSTTSMDAGRAPSIFAIRIDGLDPLGTRGIALSFLTRQQFNANLQGIRITPAGEPIPGVGYFSGEANFILRLQESWYGATLARTYGRFGIGATLFGAYRSQSGRNQMLAAAVDGTTGGSSVIEVDYYSYWQLRFLAKIGVAWDWTKFSFGASVTTPGLGAMSSATLLTSLSRINVDTGDGVASDVLVADYQKDLSAEFRSPLSVAIGGSWQINESSAIHATAEYFRKVGSYTVIDGRPYTGQTTGVQIDGSVDAASRAVLNWGFGYEQTLSPRVSLYGGVWVDRSTNEQSTESDLSFTNWDIHHVTVGSNFSVRAIRITLGVSYARGSAPIERVIDFTGVGGDSQVLRTGDALYQRVKGIIGISFEA